MRTTQMLIIREILYLPIAIWNTRSLFAQVFVAVMTASVLTPVFGFIEQYVFNDWNFLGYVLVALTFDIGSGAIKHLKLKTFDKRAAVFRFLEKGFVCFGTLVFFHVITHFGETPDEWTLHYAALMKKSIIISYLGVSFFMNVYEISNGKFPPSFIMKRFKDYDSDTGEKIQKRE